MTSFFKDVISLLTMVDRYFIFKQHLLINHTKD
jgi:hypothetical protein